MASTDHTQQLLGLPRPMPSVGQSTPRHQQHTSRCPSQTLVVLAVPIATLPGADSVLPCQHDGAPPDMLRLRSQGRARSARPAALQQRSSSSPSAALGTAALARPSRTPPLRRGTLVRRRRFIRDTRRWAGIADPCAQPSGMPRDGSRSRRLQVCAAAGSAAGGGRGQREEVGRKRWRRGPHPRSGPRKARRHAVSQRPGAVGRSGERAPRGRVAAQGGAGPGRASREGALRSRLFRPTRRAPALPLRDKRRFRCSWKEGRGGG